MSEKQCVACRDVEMLRLQYQIVYTVVCFSLFFSSLF